jgi:outer membrane protein
MKNVILMLVFTAAMAVGNTAHAQLKIGYVDYVEILNLLPEKGEADRKLEKYARDLESQRREMEQEYTQKLEKLQAQADTLSPMILQIRAKELQDLESRINAFSQAAQQDIVNKREELYNPIIDKIDAAIKAIAEEGGYKYILDASTILYGAESENVSNRVQKKLGLTP